MAKRRTFILVAILGLALSPPVDATWSILIADKKTKEVAIGSVTCLNNFDLRAITPVMLVGVGGATAQAAGDFDGIRRPIIREELLNGTDPQEIITILAGVPGHNFRQYGIVDTVGRASTFTGVLANDWAGGVIGEQGDLVYAIQGNILAGACVVEAAEQELLDTVGDIPAKLMASMEAARAMGGDGRCSCHPTQADSCGCPPLPFTKTGHIGYMLIGRIGDIDDPVCNAQGCADGDYFMNFNVAFQGGAALDPVLQMQVLFDQWRADLLGRPDAVQSSVTIAAAGTGVEMTIELVDWEETPLATGSVVLTVEHEVDSAGLSTIGPVTEVGDGVYTVSIVPDPGAGVDRFRITADDAIRPVVLMPSPTLCIGDIAGGLSLDCNSNGLADECEVFDGLAEDTNGNSIPDECERFERGNCDANDTLDLADAIHGLEYLFGDVTSVVCEKACDTDDTGNLNLADPIVLLELLFIPGRPPLPDPYQECGFDPTADALTCTPFAPCL